jgi:hypothetical protein
VSNGLPTRPKRRYRMSTKDWEIINAGLALLEADAEDEDETQGFNLKEIQRTRMVVHERRSRA